MQAKTDQKWTLIAQMETYMIMQASSAMVKVLPVGKELEGEYAPEHSCVRDDFLVSRKCSSAAR